MKIPGTVLHPGTLYKNHKTPTCLSLTGHEPSSLILDILTQMESSGKYCSSVIWGLANVSFFNYKPMIFKDKEQRIKSNIFFFCAVMEICFVNRVELKRRISHSEYLCAELLQSCPTLCDPRDCSLPGSSVHGIFQARVLEWGAIFFSDIEHMYHKF